MAVYPDRIILKNSTDAQAAIETAIGSGGSDEIVYGELVIGRESGAAKLYTVDSDGNIAVVGGGAESIDGLTDVDTTTTAPTDGQVLTWITANSQWEPSDSTVEGLADTALELNAIKAIGTEFEVGESNGNPDAETGTDWGTPNTADGIYKSGAYSYKATSVWTPMYLPGVLPLDKQYDCISSWIYSSNTGPLTICGNKDTQRGWFGNGFMLYKNSNTYTIRGTSVSTDKVVATSLATNTWHHFYVQVNYVNGRANKPEISLWINGSFIANWATSTSWNWTAPAGTWCDGAGFRMPGDTVPAVGGTSYRDRFYFKQVDTPIVGMTDPSFVVADVENEVLTTAIKDKNILYYDSATGNWINGELSVDDLADVDTTTVAPTDGQVLRWNSVTSNWEPQDLDEVIDGGNLETGTSAGDGTTIDGGLIT